MTGSLGDDSFLLFQAGKVCAAQSFATAETLATRLRTIRALLQRDQQQQVAESGSSIAICCRRLCTPRGLLTSAGSCSAQLSALTRLMNFFLWVSGAQDPTISKGLPAIVSERESSSGAQKEFRLKGSEFRVSPRGSKSPTSVVFGPPKAFKDLGVWDASGLIIRYSCSAYC